MICINKPDSKDLKSVVHQLRLEMMQSKRIRSDHIGNKSYFQNGDLKNISGIEFNHNLSTVKNSNERFKSSMRKKTPNQPRKSKFSTDREFAKSSKLHFDINKINNMCNDNIRKSHKLELITPHQVFHDSRFKKSNKQHIQFCTSCWRSQEIRDIRTAGVSNPRDYRITKTIDIFNSTQLDLSTNISKSLSKKRTGKLHLMNNKDRINVLASRKQLIKKIQSRSRHEKQRPIQKQTEYSNGLFLNNISNSYMNNIEAHEDSENKIEFQHSKKYERFYKQAVKLFNRRFTKFHYQNHIKLRKEINKSQEYLNLNTKSDPL